MILFSLVCRKVYCGELKLKPNNKIDSASVWKESVESEATTMDNTKKQKQRKSNNKKRRKKQQVKERDEKKKSSRVMKVCVVAWWRRIIDAYFPARFLINVVVAEFCGIL